MSTLEFIYKCPVCGEEINIEADDPLSPLSYDPSEVEFVHENCCNQYHPTPNKIGFEIHICSECGNPAPFPHNRVKKFRAMRPGIEPNYWCCSDCCDREMN